VWSRRVDGRTPRPGRSRGRGRLGRLGYAAGITAAVLLGCSGPAVPARAATTFVVVQMNLCNSGMAVTSCYSFGRAVDEAVTKIHRYRPDLVTLQEVCRDDVYAPVGGWGRLARAMADLYGGRRVSVSFSPAWNPYTHQPYRCVNGQQYGVALIHRGAGADRHSGWYVSQDASDEQRTWTCATVIAGRLTGCTTHLSTEADVAARQCRELMATLSAAWVLPEVVLAGDLNLTDAAGGRRDVRDCVPASYDRRSDGTLQQVFFTRNVQWIEGGHEPMRWTDHPVLYQRFRL
jgi:hypothetical protein